MPIKVCRLRKKCVVCAEDVLFFCQCGINEISWNNGAEKIAFDRFADAAQK